MNFLIIMSDEHRKDAMSCAGHKIVKTPNLDRLAQAGTLFTNAYTPSPMCVPARAAVACGNYVHKIRHWDSATPYDGKIMSWMRSLRERNIETTSIGKLHFRSTDDDNGFTQEILPMHVVDKIGWAVGLLRHESMSYDNARELADDVGFGPSSYTDYDLAITDAAQKWLKSKRQSKQPWAAFVSLVSPHYPLSPPADYYSMYDPMAVNLPIAYADNQRPSHSELQNIAEFFNYDHYFDEQKMRQAIVAYYGLVSFMDDCVGRIISALHETGQAQDTVILYVSDHGEMLGDHGLWTKQVMYEASAGVPMILCGPGIPENNRVNTAVNLTDMYQTALDVFDLDPINEPESRLPGDSLITLSRQPDDAQRTVLSEYHDGGSTTGTFMIRWDKWKYNYYVGHPAQLFNLETDPQERNDLAQTAGYQSVIEDANRRLRRICDPEAVNQQCFDDQAARIEELGGVDACKNAFVFNHTPAPN